MFAGLSSYVPYTPGWEYMERPTTQNHYRQTQKNKPALCAWLKHQTREAHLPLFPQPASGPVHLQRRSQPQANHLPPWTQAWWTGPSVDSSTSKKLCVSLISIQRRKDTQVHWLLPPTAPHTEDGPVAPGNPGRCHHQGLKRGSISTRKTHTQDNQHCKSSEH